MTGWGKLPCLQPPWPRVLVSDVTSTPQRDKTEPQSLEQGTGFFFMVEMWPQIVLNQLLHLCVKSGFKHIFSKCNILLFFHGIVALEDRQFFQQDWPFPVSEGHCCPSWPAPPARTEGGHFNINSCSLQASKAHNSPSHTSERKKEKHKIPGQQLKGLISFSFGPSLLLEGLSVWREELLDFVSVLGGNY